MPVRTGSASPFTHKSDLGVKWAVALDSWPFYSRVVRQYFIVTASTDLAHISVPFLLGWSDGSGRSGAMTDTEATRHLIRSR